jgi:hypothetical protein
MQEVRVIIPEERIKVIQFIQDETRGFAEVNHGLKDLQSKIVFAWHLSIMIDLQDVNDFKLPEESEKIVLSDFELFLSDLVLGSDPNRPNGIFLARIDWNSTRELIWRVYEANAVNQSLQQIIGTGIPPRPFDYRIDNDPTWKLAEWHLQD